MHVLSLSHTHKHTLSLTLFLSLPSFMTNILREHSLRTFSKKIFQDVDFHKNLNFYDNECYQEIQFVREINRRIIRLKISPRVNRSMFLDNVTVFM